MSKVVIEVKPLDSIGQVRLGLTKTEVLELIGKPSNSNGKQDFYQSEEYFFSVNYNLSDTVEYIEHSAWNESTKVHFRGIDVFRTPANELIEQIVALGFDVDETNSEIPYSYVFHELELSFWRPVVPGDELDEIEEEEDDEEYEEDEKEGRYFSTVGVGMKGYYTR